MDQQEIKSIGVVFYEGNPNHGCEKRSQEYTYVWPYKDVPIAVGEYVVVQVGERLKAVEVVAIYPFVPRIATKFPVCKVDLSSYLEMTAKKRAMEDLKDRIVKEAARVQKTLALKELAKKSKELKALLAMAEGIGLDLEEL